MKTLLLNGSPHEKGSTYTALTFVAAELVQEGIEAEILHVSKEPISGCRACYACRSNGRNRCAFDGDVVNVVLEKIEAADALVLGSPTYYAAPNGQFLAVLDRVFFTGSAAGLLAGKPAAAICAARRGGTTATLEVLQKYFTIAGMPIAPATYWPMIHGMSAEEVVKDLEGVQTMRMIGKTVAWLLKCIEAGKREGLAYPTVPGGEKVATNFIR